MADDKAIPSMNPPEHEVDDKKTAKANPPAKVVDEESLVVQPEKSDAELQKQKKKRSKKVLCCWCCGIILAVLLLVAVILIILAFTAFKARDPTITVENISLASVSISVSISLSPISINAVANANVSVHNPNVVGFSYDSSTAYIFYRGEQVADAPIAAGHIKAHGNEQLFIPVQVTLSTNDINGNLANDLLGTLPLVSKVDITGHVKVLFVSIKVRASATCNISYFTRNGTDSYSCQYSTKL